MATSKLKCTGCKSRFPAEGMISTPAGKFHDKQCMMKYAYGNKDKLVKKGRTIKANIEKEERRELKRRKEKLKPMSAHYDKLQELVNQWIVHVRDVGKPCFTCGTTNPSIKYDAGHYRTRKSAPEIRFEPKNIHKQCSVNCNQHGSGMRKEYRDKIVEVYGQDTLDWLDGPHPRLKDQLPDMDAVNVEIARYRKLLRDAGLKPCR